MRVPRRVTVQPTGTPARRLNPAIGRLASVTTGFWPAMAASSRTVLSTTRWLTGTRRPAWASAAALPAFFFWPPSCFCRIILPMPMLSLMATSRGTAIGEP